MLDRTFNAGRRLGICNHLRDLLIVEVWVVNEHLGEQVGVSNNTLELLIEEVFEDITMLESSYEVGQVGDPIVVAVGIGVGIPDVGRVELVRAELCHDEREYRRCFAKEVRGERLNSVP